MAAARGRSRGVDVAGLGPLHLPGRAASIGGGEGDAGGLEALLVLNRFNDALETDLADSFYVSKEKYLQFWGDISHDAAKFLAHLVTKLVQGVKIIARGRKPSPGVHDVAAVHQCPPATALLHCHNCLLSTIFYVALHFDYHIQTATGDDNLHSAMQAWRKQLKHGKPCSTDFAWEVYNFVAQKGARLAGDDGLSFTDHLESAVHIESDGGPSTPLPALPAQAAQATVGPAWTWLYLRHRFITGPDCSVALGRAFSEMVDMLRVHNTESRLLCVLHMLTETMYSFPGLPREPLHQLVAALDTFVCWPRPFGPLAQTLISLAERELASSGAVVRELFLKEHPSVAEVCGESPVHLHGMKGSVAVLMDFSTTNAQYLELALTVPSRDNTVPEELESLVPTAAALLLDILQRAGSHVLDVPSAADSLLRSLVNSDPTTVLNAYREARKVDLAAQACSQDAARAQLENLGQIALQIFGDAVATDAIGEASPWRRPAVRRTRLDSQVNPNMSQQMQSSLSRHLKYSIHALTKSAEHVTWPTSPVSDAAAWLQSFTRDLSPGDVVPIGVAGGTQSLHHILNAYEIVKSQRQDWSTGLNVFLLPTGSSENALADFIGKFDCWYSRHVLVPLASSLPSYPHILFAEAAESISQELSAAEITHTGRGNSDLVQPALSPLWGIRSLVENYFRHAKMALKVQVYRCDCWLHHQVDGAPAQQTIFFYDRLCVGSSAVAEARQGRGVVTGETTVLNVNLHTLGLDGQVLGPKVSHRELLELDGDPLAEWSFSQLDLSNIPRRDQAVACTGPSTASLEMLAEVEEVNKKKSKKNESRGLREYVAGVEISPGTQLSMETSRFSMVADGVLYGPFSRVLVTQAPSQVLNVMTYFPFN